MKSDQAYYYDRAEAELRLAQQASEPAVVKVHYQLAGHYLDRVYGNAQQPEAHGNGPVAEQDDNDLRKKADQLARQLRAAGIIIVEPPPGP